MLAPLEVGYQRELLVNKEKFLTGQAAGLSNGVKMKPTKKIIDPEDYILSALSPQDRLDAALKIAREAFKGTKLTMRDIDSAVKSVMRKAYEGKT